VDIYDPGNATRAVVFLHGAGGSSSGMACDLGINTNVTVQGTANSNPVCVPATGATVSSWLASNKVLAIFPQGQSMQAGATPTWSNRVMDSGQDDVAFLKSLAAYLKSTYPAVASHLYLAGHSNGGMMVNRIRCEASDTYRAYVAMSGPASIYYAASACVPSVATAPYLSIMGGVDSVLQDQPFTAPSWAVDPIYVAAVRPASAWVAYQGYPLGALVGEQAQQQDRVTRMCGETLSASPTLSANGSSKTWTNCGGKLVLVNIVNADHFMYSLQSVSGQSLIDAVASFVSSN
jgi:poly(3-hydroxybutyrate) depolymerase